MNSSLPRRVSSVLATLAIVACHRGATVSSPAPAAGTGATAAAAPANRMPSTVTPAMIEEGRTLFSANACARCHGPTGGGAQNGPNLTDATWAQIDGSYAAIVKIIHDGVPKANIKGPSETVKYPFAMRPMGGGNFTDAQINSIAAYVFSISHK
jgi:mono/diheme cytochrome c family protein